MNRVQLLLLTAPVEVTRARPLLKQLGKRAGNVSIRLLGTLWEPTRNPLTPRQREVLAGIAVGVSVKELAHRLGISPKTVETHRTQLMNRLGIWRVPELLRYAILHRVVPASWLAQV